MNITGKTLSFSVLAMAVLLNSAVRAQDVVVVANPGVLITTVTSAQLRDIFTGVHSTFPDRSRAVPVTLKGGPVHEVFLRNHLGETPDGFRTFWRKLLFSGQGVPPKEFASEAALLQFVAETPGAIGYVSRVSDGVNVKVLVVQRNSR